MAESVSGNKIWSPMCFQREPDHPVSGSWSVVCYGEFNIVLLSKIPEKGTNIRFKCVSYCHILFSLGLLSLQVTREVGKSQCNISTVAMVTLQFKEVYVQKLQRKGPSWKAHKKQKLSGDLWNHATIFLKVTLAPPLWDKDKCFKHVATGNSAKQKYLSPPAHHNSLRKSFLSQQNSAP